MSTLRGGAVLALTILLLAGCDDGVAPTAPRDQAASFAHTADHTCELAVTDEEALLIMDELIAEVLTLENAGALNAGQSRALRNHMTNARRQIEAGRLCPAIAQIRAFRDQVLEFVADGVLTGSEAAPLLAGVDRLLLPPPPVVSIDPVLIATGGFHSCGLTTSGRAYCWGQNNQGQIGDGTVGNERVVPTAVTGGLRFVSITTGWQHTCGVSVDGIAYCWGQNDHGQLGDGTTVNRSGPTAVSTNLLFASLTSSFQHTCGLTTVGAAYCWGRSEDGRLGATVGDAAQTTPVAVDGGLTFNALSAGITHTCGIGTGGTAYCWGNNTDGQLGDGSTASRVSPQPVSGSSTFAKIGAGQAFTCGVTPAGVAYCWGRNTHGQLADGSLDSRPVPAPVAAGLTFDGIATGTLHACGTTPAGPAYCWGFGAGVVGDGDASALPRTQPTAVSGGLSISAVSAGYQQTCALTTVGAAYCWGANLVGQLGNGVTSFGVNSPTPVSGWAGLP